MKYRVYKDTKLTETQLVKKSLKPKINHSKTFTFGKVTKEHLEFFESGCITFLVYGTQEDTSPDPKLMKYSTKVCFNPLDKECLRHKSYVSVMYCGLEIM